MTGTGGGLSTDLIIEQTLMRTVKTDGGLTRGRGMEEQQRVLWLLSLPNCAKVNHWMQSLTNTVHATSVQHKDSSQARQSRDQKDTAKLNTYLANKNPFDSDDKLRSIVTGKEADESVNAYNAKVIGEMILKDFTLKSASEVSFKRSNQATTMKSTSSLKLKNGEVVQFDSQLLFQRLLAVVANERGGVQDIFQYELTTMPTSLFDDNGFMRDANKHTLAEYLWSENEVTSNPPVPGSTHVIDGGSLIHLLPWPRGSTYLQLAQM